MIESRKREIEKIADDVRSECRIAGYAIENIFMCAEKIGLRVIRLPIGEQSFMGFALIKNGDKIVFSNSSLIQSREIFTIAHEIGHHKLHLSVDGMTIIKDDTFEEKNEAEIEANYFAASLLMPFQQVESYIRYELEDKYSKYWTGLDIAKIQTTFNVSYDMVLNRLKELNKITQVTYDKLKLEKKERTTTKLLSIINGNLGLCTSSNIKSIPPQYIEWVIKNYNEKLVPVESVNKALQYVGLTVGDVEDEVDPVKNTIVDDWDELLGGIDE